MSNSSLLEAIAAAILDGTTLTFSPADVDGTSLPTGMVVGVRLQRDGQTYGDTTEIDFRGLSLSRTAETMLADALTETVAPVISAARKDANVAEPVVDGGPPLVRERDPA